VLFRLDERAHVLRAVTASGTLGLRLDDLELPLGRGASGVAAMEQRPVSMSNVYLDTRLRLPDEVGARLAAEGLIAIVAVPLLALGPLPRAANLHEGRRGAALGLRYPGLGSAGERRRLRPPGDAGQVRCRAPGVRPPLARGGDREGHPRRRRRHDQVPAGN